jgi:hypothetical protein
VLRLAALTGRSQLVTRSHNALSRCSKTVAQAPAEYVPSEEIAMKRRKNDSPDNRKTYFRSDRIFRSNGQWFFHTREGIDVGPFQSEFEAQVESSILKNVLKETRTRDGAIATIREFLLDARTSTSNLTSFTDYVVKEGRF